MKKPNKIMSDTSCVICSLRLSYGATETYQASYCVWQFSLSM